MVVKKTYENKKINNSNELIKKTYILLSMTLFFSGFMSFLGLHLERSFDNLLMWILGGIIVLILMYPFQDSIIGLILAFAFTGWDGYWAGPFIKYYLELPQGEQIVMWSAIVTALIFLSLSAYIHITKKDFDYWGGFLMNSLIALLLLLLLKTTLNISISFLILSYFGVLLFSAYILFDTSRIVNGHETSYVSATIDLYLDIMIIFFDLLRIIAGWFKKFDLDDVDDIDIID